MFDFLQNAYVMLLVKNKRPRQGRVEIMRMMVLMMVMTKTMVVTLEALFVNRC